MNQRKPGWLHKNYDIIRALIPQGSRVLDLGCGNGSVIRNLQIDKGVRGMGVEIDEEKIIECVKNGVPVIQGDLDLGLSKFRDNSFDFVILNQTLQVVRKPDFVLEEILRVGCKAIVGFPNFGFCMTRFALMTSGRMPVNNHLPFEWYNSPNIHLFTINDFKSYCKEKKILIHDSYYLQAAKASLLINLFPNCLATEAVFLLGKADKRCV